MCAFKFFIVTFLAIFAAFSSFRLSSRPRCDRSFPSMTMWGESRKDREAEMKRKTSRSEIDKHTHETNGNSKNSRSFAPWQKPRVEGSEGSLVKPAAGGDGDGNIIKARIDQISQKKTPFQIPKLGQQVIDTSLTVNTEGEVIHVSPFKKKVTRTFQVGGPGSDERKSILSDDDEENEFATLSKIDRSFRQKSLQACLSSSSLSHNSKFESVARASSQESILPVCFPNTSNVKAGGLLKEWDFDFE